ncbi:hypothetical protein NKDENANG_01343 [Candidatus Entotheonellaceae bacterium PAL068K]
MTVSYELLFKGGEVIDPLPALQQRCDVAFHDRRVAALRRRQSAHRVSTRSCAGSIPWSSFPMLLILSLHRMEG